jgi:CHASE3 domain sensor protein
MGKRFRESADAFTNYISSNSGKDLETAIERQTRAFFIQYVLAIIGLVIMGIYIVVIIGMLASGRFR